MRIRQFSARNGAAARLSAWAAVSVLGVALWASVQTQPNTPATARHRDDTGKLDASNWQALQQAYADGDAELADSLERVIAARARHRSAVTPPADSNTHSPSRRSAQWPNKNPPE